MPTSLGEIIKDMLERAGFDWPQFCTKERDALDVFMDQLVTFVIVDDGSVEYIRSVSHVQSEHEQENPKTSH